MIDGDCRRPDGIVVAVFADICRLNVRWAFTGRIGAVVASDAVTRNVHVIEVCRQPASRRVTIVAVIAGSDVRRVLAGGRDAVMTGATSA